MNKPFLAVILVIMGLACHASGVNEVLSLKVEKRLITQNVIERFHVKSPGGSISLLSLVGKPIKSSVSQSLDGETKLNWVVGAKNQKFVLVIGTYKNEGVFLVDSLPSKMPTNYSYGEYPVWLPLNGSRVLWWGFGSRECSILDVRGLRENPRSGYFSDEAKKLVFKSFDAIDPSLGSIIAPFEFKRIGPDDSSDIVVIKGKKILKITEGFVHSWVDL